METRKGTEVVTARACATKECPHPVVRPLPCEYCEECCVNQLGAEIEKRPIGAVYAATKRTSAHPAEVAVDDWLSRFSVEQILRGVAEGMRRHARAAYGSETVPRFEYEQGADSLLDFAANLPRRLRVNP